MAYVCCPTLFLLKHLKIYKDTLYAYRIFTGVPFLKLIIVIFAYSFFSFYILLDFSNLLIFSKNWIFAFLYFLMCPCLLFHPFIPLLLFSSVFWGKVVISSYCFFFLTSWDGHLIYFRPFFFLSSNPSLCPNEYWRSWSWTVIWRPTRSSRTNCPPPQKKVLFIIGDQNAKVGIQEKPAVTCKLCLGVQNEAGQRLKVLSRDPLPTTQGRGLHMKITRWSIAKS